MTLPPKDYIAERRREITQQMEAFRNELALLDRMESALRGAAPDYHPPIHREEVVEQPRKRRYVEGGIKAVVMRVLTGLEDGKSMTAQDILVAMKVFYGVDIPRTSLSPQLSRLRSDKDVDVKESGWFATKQGREHYPNEKN